MGRTLCIAHSEAVDSAAENGWTGGHRPKVQILFSRVDSGRLTSLISTDIKFSLWANVAASAAANAYI